MTTPHRGILAAAYWFAFVATLLFAGVYAVHSWDRYEDVARDRLALTTTMIAAATEDILTSEGSRLAFLAEELHRTQAFRHPGRARTLLRQYQRVSPDTADVSLVAPNGQVLVSGAATADATLANKANNAFSGPRLQQALGHHGLEIHHPLYVASTQHWMIRLSYTEFASSGKPLFVLVTQMRFGKFDEFLVNLPLQAGMAAGLLRDNFYMEDREPIPHGDLRALLGRPQTGVLAQILRNHPGLRKGFFDGLVTADQVYRFGAFVHLKGYPLIAFTDIPRARWVAEWWDRYIEIPLVFLLVALGFSFFAYNRIQVLGRRWEEDKERQKGILRSLIHHDPLTGLLNRMGLHPILNRALARADRHERLLGIGFLDIDEFKSINDNYGHPAGDAVLKDLALRLKGAVRGTDMVARLGGDEFVLIIEGLRTLADLELVVENIRAALARPFVTPEQTLSVQVSLGLTVYPLDETDVDGLLRHADQAMYVAKARPPGSGRWVQMYKPHLSIRGGNEADRTPPPPEKGT
ncbi:MAG TPA: diguanylate cyclase [Acidiferrobacter sp.]|nr:diguanylate cyclase [Acidiferrobacter sp.]